MGLIGLNYACKQKETQKNFLHQQQNQTIFCLTRWFNETDNDFSFPVFFEQEMIRKHKIKQIERKKFEYIDGDSTLSEKYTYHFSETGFIHEIEISYYYDDFMIDHYVLLYPTNFNKDGYSFPIVKHLQKDSLKLENVKLPFDLHLYKRENDFTSSYLELQNKSFYYFLKDKNTGIYKVGREINPRKKDLIFYGNIRKSKKWHRLENKVIENDVVIFTYEHNHLVKNTFKKGNFLTKRHYRFNKHSVDKIVDSVFVNEVFLHTEQISFAFQKNKLPYQWICKRGGKINMQETFDYETYH